MAGVLVNCLAVIGASPERFQQLNRFGQRDWESLLPWMDRSGIALPFWARLKSLGAEDIIPRPVSLRLARNLADQRRRVAAMIVEFDSLNRRFERSGIEYAVWKGFSLIPEYCPHADLRPSYDYDYLVSEDARDGALQVLKSAGYVGKPEQGVNHHLTFLPPHATPRFSSVPGGLYSPLLPRKVELHFRLWDQQAFRIPLRVPERPLDGRQRRAWHGLSFHSLGEEDVLLFQSLHTFQHILHNWCRLGWLREIAYFLEGRSRDASFWARFHARLEGNQSLVEIVALVFTLAARLFQAALPAAIKDQLLGAMRGQVSLWVDHYGLRSALHNFSEDKYPLFLYREFVQDDGTWRQLLRNRLLPLHRPHRLPAAMAPAASAPRSDNWVQSRYLVQRLIHHALRGAGYVWESARWEHLRRIRVERSKV